MSEQYYYGTGRRKDAVARVFIKSGSGNILVNKRPAGEYFPRETAQILINRPMEAVGMLGKFDVYATTNGGGINGQAGAIVLGLARALVNYDEATTTDSGEGEGSNDRSFRRLLRAGGHLTRDARIVERKKIGRHKARKGTQFSKR